MGQIIKFEDTFESRGSPKNKKNPLDYRNNIERSWPIKDRTERVDHNKTTPAIRFVTNSFRDSLEELQKNGFIDLSVFPSVYDIKLRKFDYFLPEEAMKQIEKLKPEQKEEIIYDMVVALHNGWVHDYSEDFFCLYIDWEFVYLPIELVGREFFLSYLESIKVFSDRFGLSVDEDEMSLVYDKKRKEFMVEHEIDSGNFNSLTKAIVYLSQSYSALSDEISAVLAEKELAFDVARQVVYHNPELFNKYGVG